MGDLFPSELDLKKFVAAAKSTGSVDDAFVGRYGASPDDAFLQWARERPRWRYCAVALTSTRTIFFLAMLLFVAVAFYSFWRRKRSYERLPG